MLSYARLTPSMLIPLTPAPFSTPVNASLVNWLPWSLLKIIIPHRREVLRGRHNRVDECAGVADGSVTSIHRHDPRP